MDEDRDKGKAEDVGTRESEDELSEEELDTVSGGKRPDGGGGGNVTT
jgi:bacteriocin-like protein